MVALATGGDERPLADSLEAAAATTTATAGAGVRVGQLKRFWERQRGGSDRGGSDEHWPSVPVFPCRPRREGGELKAQTTAHALLQDTPPVSTGQGAAAQPRDLDQGRRERGRGRWSIGLRKFGPSSGPDAAPASNDEGGARCSGQAAEDNQCRNLPRPNPGDSVAGSTTCNRWIRLAGAGRAADLQHPPSAFSKEGAYEAGAAGLAHSSSTNTSAQAG